MRQLGKERGDTIIEVMLAFAVFALLAVGAMTIMNRGTQLAQRALEVTLVRQQIDAQADTLRYIHDTAHTDDASSAYTDWRTITTKQVDGGLAVDAANQFGTDATGECPAVDAIDSAFVLNARTGALSGVAPQAADAAPFSEVVYDQDAPDSIEQVSGIWIQSVKSGNSNQNYVDFHIRACWYAAGGDPATLGTIVRMYDAVE